ncbi:MAG: ATP-binding protein [Ruminococcaceae bacterium]|nr:ATP-binding protein [Oscillospiraceae bacterium]
MNITKGKLHHAKKVVIYGPEGIGKSSLAAKFPDAIFIDTEGSTSDMDVARMDKPLSWAMLKAQVEYVKQHKPCRSLIIDTADWAEALCITAVCEQHGKNGIEDFGYGNGYVYEKEEFGRFLNLLGEVVESGINVVLTAHAILRKFEQPDEMGAYDRWELKLGKKTTNLIAPLVKEWADMVLFANYKTLSVAVDKEGKKHKAQGGRRVIYTSHHPCWDAKNRHGLPEEIPMDYEQIRHIIEPVQAAPISAVNESYPVPLPTEPPAEYYEQQFPETLNEASAANVPPALAELMTATGVTEEEICKVVSMKGYFPADMPIKDYPMDFVNGVLIGAWDKVHQMILENR